MTATTTLVDLFARTAAAHPDAPAVSDPDRQLTYAALATEVDALAAELVALGVRPENRVAIHLPRGVGVLVAMLAVLRAGAAYLPVDDRYPHARRDQMLTDGRVRLVITPAGWDERLAHLGCTTLAFDGRARQAAPPANPPAPVLPVVTPAAAACVLYTSGSTGRPKGVVLEHRQLVSFALDPALPVLGPGERTAQSAGISFDTLTFEVWRSLAGGAEIVVIPSIPDLIGADFQRQLRRHRITAMLAPAIALNHLARHDREAFSSLHLLCSGGDVLLADTCRELRAGGFTGELFNLYGPTEATVACSGHLVGHLTDETGHSPGTGSSPGTGGTGTDRTSQADPTGQSKQVPIGRPFDAARLYVLDERLRPADPGVAGELYVGGAGVGRGYLDQPGQTARRFLADPFAADGSRMYATGDRVRRTVDGVLEYLGRVDSQVKIQGIRVEPAEVERLLYGYPHVQEAAVAAVGEAGDKRLVAFVVPAAERLPLADLRGFLAERLIAPLVPAEFVVLDTMPLDVHGKRDWAALADMAADRASRRRAYVAPRTDTEKYVVRLWEDLLSIESIGVHDDFFALGGHSLLAVRGRISIQQDLHTTLPPEVLFNNSVAEDLARTIDEVRHVVPTPHS